LKLGIKLGIQIAISWLIVSIIVCMFGHRDLIVLDSYGLPLAKEGVGRSNRLGDANKIKGLQPGAVALFFCLPLNTPIIAVCQVVPLSL